MVLTRIASISSLKNRVLVLGTGPQAQRIERAERELRPANFIVLGFAPVEPCHTCVAEERVVRANDLLALSEKPFGRTRSWWRWSTPELSMPRETLLQFRLRGIRILDTATFFEREFGQLEIDRPYPNWLLFSNGTTIAAAAKQPRSGPSTSRSAWPSCCSPCRCSASRRWLSNLEDGGPSSIARTASGEGRKFPVLKFRSMRTDAEQDGVAHWATSTTIA